VIIEKQRLQLTIDTNGVTMLRSDVMLQETENRFSSSAFVLAVRWEKVLMKATADNVVPTDLTTLDLMQSFNGDKLSVQLNQLKDFLNAGNFTAISVSQLAQMLPGVGRRKLYRLSSLK